MSWTYDKDNMTSRNDRCDWISYGDFGRDTYGLHTRLNDGTEAVLRIDADTIEERHERADALLRMVTDGYDHLDPETRANGELMTVHNASKVLGVSVQRVHQMMKEGKLDGKKYGSIWMLDSEQVQSLRK